MEYFNLKILDIKKLILKKTTLFVSYQERVVPIEKYL